MEPHSGINNKTLWVVWYEDRFGWGPDRDPASMTAYFKSLEEANDYINKHEGPIDIESGKFDGLFTQEWKAGDAVKVGLMTKEAVEELFTHT